MNSDTMEKREVHRRIEWAAMRALGALLFLLMIVPTAARAADFAQLGSLEQGTVDTALTQRGLAVDPAPAGKIVGIIHVVNLDVFQPSDGWLLQWFNHFHWTTREHHIRRESLLKPGMLYDPAQVEETVRNLRNRTSYSDKDPPMSGIVSMVPVKSSVPGSVDVLIATRDVWSLRFSSSYDFQLFSFNLPTLTASLSENNLFGRRKNAALSFIMDQGEIWLGPNYLDTNLLGSHLRLTFSFHAIGPIATWTRSTSGKMRGLVRRSSSNSAVQARSLVRTQIFSSSRLKRVSTEFFQRFSELSHFLGRPVVP
jgi:hypothetical protein